MKNILIKEVYENTSKKTLSSTFFLLVVETLKKSQNLVERSKI